MTGGTGSEFDLLYTYRDGKLFKDTAMYTSQIAYTFRDGKIYKGDSSFLLDILYTIKNGVIYEGDQAFAMDALYAIDGKYGDTDIFAILLSLGLIT